MRIEVICTGDEVLTGKVVNTNFSTIAQKLEDCGLAVEWETTVGDDRYNLLLAFQLAGQRADAVIVNGGLGPTVDDLSQEIAAKAAGVALELNQQWLATMQDYFKRRSRVMPPNNIKQAILPATAEVLDNPVGTACGFALTRGKASFMFTPCVPRELRRMLEEQIIPRLLAKSGKQSAIYLKRFHSYGIGESHADTLLAGIESLAPEGNVKPASIRQVLARWGLRAGRVAYVGDSASDIHAAREAGVVPLGAAWVATTDGAALRAAAPLETFDTVEGFLGWIEDHVEFTRR